MDISEFSSEKQEFQMSQNFFSQAVPLYYILPVNTSVSEVIPYRKELKTYCHKVRPGIISVSKSHFH